VLDIGYQVPGYLAPGIMNLVPVLGNRFEVPRYVEMLRGVAKPGNIRAGNTWTEVNQLRKGRRMTRWHRTQKGHTRLPTSWKHCSGNLKDRNRHEAVCVAHMFAFCFVMLLQEALIAQLLHTRHARSRPTVCLTELCSNISATRCPEENRTNIKFTHFSLRLLEALLTSYP